MCPPEGSWVDTMPLSQYLAWSKLQINTGEREDRMIRKARRAEVCQSHSKHTEGGGSDVFKHLATVAGRKSQTG